MWHKKVYIPYTVCVLAMINPVMVAAAHSQTNAAAVDSTVPSPVELVRYKQEYSSARIEQAHVGTHVALAIIFEGTGGLHYYAKVPAGTAAGLELRVEAKSDDFGFGKPIFPAASAFTDPLGNKVEVYAGRFTVFVPIIAVRAPTKNTVIDKGKAVVKISGLACTSMACLEPFEKTLHVTVDLNLPWREVASESTNKTVQKTPEPPYYSVWFALLLALIAGLSLNIMPCVWPVLPLIVMRLVEQAKQDKGKSIAMGFIFCLGILLFFASLAGANIVLQVFYGTVLQWGDQFRNPAFVAGMAFLLVVLAQFCFGVFAIGVPSSIASKSGTGKGYLGAVGMGFLAAILSTPCSFAILAAAFAWAQAQPLLPATVAIMVIGIGMAVPYAILTSMPGLLKRLPKAGRWMELFKQAIGFVLLVIAVKLIGALPEMRRMNVLYFAVVLGFCVWMWGGWVGYDTKLSRKWLVRIIAMALAVAAGWSFLRAPAGGLIDWQGYDANLIETARIEGRPVLIKFTADWCLSCQAVEKIVYSRKDVAKLIKEKGVLAIKADTTTKDLPATFALKNVYNEPGVPVSMLFAPGEKEPVRWRGMSFADELKAFLEKLP
jgi:thiol:disulfide interchange protein